MLAPFNEPCLKSRFKIENVNLSVQNIKHENLNINLESYQYKETHQRINIGLLNNLRPVNKELLLSHLKKDVGTFEFDFQKQVNLNLAHDYIQLFDSNK